MVNDSPETPEHKERTAPSVSAARVAIVRYLAGDSFDADALMGAVRELAQHAPGELAALHRAATGSQAAAALAAECPDVQEALPDYVALGPQAERAMPGVRRHVQACRHCALRRMALVAADDERPRWLELSRRLAAADEADEMLELLDRGWHWVKEGVAAALTRADLELRRHIGAFALRLPAALAVGGLHFAGSGPERFALSIGLGENDAEVDLLVVPERRDSWRLWCALDRASRVRAVSVGVGTADERPSDMRLLRMNKPVHFVLDPPPTPTSRWLYFEWQSPSGERREHKAALPLREARKRPAD